MPHKHCVPGLCCSVDLAEREVQVWSKLATAKMEERTNLRVMNDQQYLPRLVQLGCGKDLIVE
jgi:hypothetical protein